MSKRESLVVTRDLKRNLIHFCSTKLQGEDLWFPCGEDALFLLIEKLMVSNGIAINVTIVEALRICGDSVDYEVVYNTPIQGSANGAAGVGLHGVR